ncbi:CsbD family protein [Dermacoccaceae bacterium W4C1]
MGIGDKIKNAAQDLAGQAKEKVGEAQGDSQLQGEGKADQSEASLKNAGENVKDAASDVKDAFKD